MRFQLETEQSSQKYFPETVGTLRRCPHCGSARPAFTRAHAVPEGVYSNVTGKKNYWAIYQCSTCALPITLWHKRVSRQANSSHYFHEYEIIPATWVADDSVPANARRYLEQAQATIGAPDASVVMSASAIDAMLKEKGLVDGSLYKRIKEAVEGGLLTNDMSKWAHLVRLNSNNPRHADGSNPHMTTTDATLSLQFAKAIAEVLFVLPSRMPEAEGTSSANYTDD